MKARRLMTRTVLGIVAASFLGCAAPTERPGRIRSTLVVGIDVSGSFRQHYDDAIDFTAHYLFGHLNGLGGLTMPTAVFVGSVGGARPGEAKSFQPIHAFTGKSVTEIDAELRNLFPPQDSYTDFNAFFDRVATLVKRRNLALAPLEIVILSDGVPDATPDASGNEPDRYGGIDLDPIEYLSRRVTVRLLYPAPTVAVAWERNVKRNRVRMWTVDWEVMAGWREQIKDGQPIDDQEPLWDWLNDNVDFRVRNRVL